MSCESHKERMKRKDANSEKAKKVLAEKGDKMNKAEKAFVGTFVKKEK